MDEHPTVETIAAFLEGFAPKRLAAEWDNVGLLVGDPGRVVRRLMTCLTVTPATAAEAVEDGADLLVTHHPLPFRPLRRLTADTPGGRMLLDLIAARVAVHSPHTAFDSAAQGINQRLAEGLGLGDIKPLVPDEEGLGTGRWGRLAPRLTLGQLVDRAGRFLSVDQLQYVGDPERTVGTVAVACGSAGELVDPAHRLGCDAMLVGETRFHTCLDAEAAGIALVIPGHFASERFAVECLAEVLAAQFAGLDVWPSRQERDPLRWRAIPQKSPPRQGLPEDGSGSAI
jgi:dinuclear metal center YbgI/SA1388 family protein